MGLREGAIGNSPVPKGEKVKLKESSVHKKKKNKNYKQILILAVDALRERKLRSALTILMVIAGGALMVALDGMSAGNTAFINNQINSLAPNIMFVSSGQHRLSGPSAPPTIIFNSQVISRIKSLPFVQDVIPEYKGTLQLNAQGNIQSASVTAMNPIKIYEKNPSMLLVPGSAIKPGDPTAMLVGNTVAYPPGDPGPFLTVGQYVRGSYTYSKALTTTATSSSSNGYGTPTTATKTFVVSAIMQPTGDSGTDQSIYINEAEGNKLFNKAYKYDAMMVTAKSPDYVNVVAKEITDLYGANNIGVTTPAALLQTRQQFQSGTAAFTLGIAFIALLVGAVGIITTLYTSVNERVKEIGTMKAIGAKNLFILALFMSEASLIGLLGATSGILMGIGGAYVLSDIAPHSTSGPGGGGGGGGAPAHINPIFIPSDLLHVWVLSLLLSMGAGILPAWKASRLSPLEALRR
ncbi:MAG: ABC transporter permease [Candidatus Nitrosopolaris sp.]